MKIRLILCNFLVKFRDVKINVVVFAAQTG